MCRVLEDCSHIIDLFGGKFGFTSVTENLIHNRNILMIKEQIRV